MFNVRDHIAMIGNYCRLLFPTALSDTNVLKLWRNMLPPFTTQKMEVAGFSEKSPNFQKTLRCHISEGCRCYVLYDPRNKQLLFCEATLSDFWALSQNFEERQLVSSCLPVRPFVRMEKLGSHWMDIYEIWYLSIFLKSFEKIQVRLKSDKN